MKAKSIMIAGVSALILGSVPAMAAGDSRAQSAQPGTAAERAADRAGTEIEKSVNADDTFTKAELDSAIKLDAVERPKQTLSTAKVDDMSGQVVGEVRDVMLDSDGDPTSLHVEVGGFLGVGERTVAIDARRFSYIPDRNILIASLTKGEIEAMTPVSR